eukprot:CAMPEP_0204323840 /NCGR_PEP_ID=MMETSP0469-20131031/9749_1 /ASSEMBLY_ACC=CAM_ASM_000384 /TAXON_ID=2969 /ORGANISM="Oxyrrhis marina" /LENGTH=546 /DNA_ID=CAMNT_0051305385 /DNA_START=34 /DNA_END=1674 /DNA_ORIENTATION=-
MTLQFFLIVREDDPRYGTRWVRDPAKIRNLYLRSWFIIDFLSVLPFDVLALTMGEGARAAKLARLLRVLRLLKLIRVLRASRVFQRYRTRLSVAYAKLELVKFVVVILACVHWMACVWGMLLSFVEKDEVCDPRDPVEGCKPTWFSESMGSEFKAPDIGEYTASLHWAVMTLTSIGYGDIAPQNNLEYTVGVVLMVIGASTWAYILGSACRIVASLDENGIEYRQTMDKINYMIKDSGLSDSLRMRLRYYFHQSQRIERVKGYKALQQRMSTALRADVCVETTKEWLFKIWFFKNCPSHIVQRIAVLLSLDVFAPKEFVLLPLRMCVLNRGLAAINGKVFSAGAVWGLDIVLDMMHLIEQHRAFSFTFSEIFSISKNELDTIRREHPEEAKRFRQAQLWLSFRAAIRFKKWRLTKKDNAGVGKAHQDRLMERFTFSGNFDNAATAPVKESDEFEIQRTMLSALNDSIQLVHALSQRVSAVNKRQMVLLEAVGEGTVQDGDEDASSRVADDRLAAACDAVYGHQLLTGRKNGGRAPSSGPRSNPQAG